MKSKKKTTTPLFQAFIDTTQIEGVKSLNSPVFPQSLTVFQNNDSNDQSQVLPRNANHQ